MVGELRLHRAGVRLALLLLVGAVAHLIVVAKTTGDTFDLGSMGLVDDALHHHPLGVYGLTDGNVPRWPYPPGFFPFILALMKAASVAGVSAANALRMPGVAADLVLAWLIWLGLGWRGRSEPVRLLGAAAAAVGPVFLAISADHGQIDAVAIVFAVAGMLVWERRVDDPRRALYAGLLIGCGAAIKTVPIVLVFALLPWARNRREGLTLLVAACAVPFVLVLPFLGAHPSDTIDALRYHGGAGIGGLSLVAQPDLAVGWLAGGPLELTSFSDHLQSASGPMAAVAVLATAMLLWRRRPSPEVGAALLVLALYVFGVNFFLQYAVWGIPFFILAGWVPAAIALEIFYLVPLAIRYGVTLAGHGAPTAPTVRSLYVPAMIGLWEGFAVAFAVLATKVARGGRTVDEPAPAPPRTAAA